MGSRFDAYLAGRIATEPTLGTTKDGRAWTRFSLAVDDRLCSAETGEWETAQTIFRRDRGTGSGGRLGGGTT
jgi:single-stranded DNA-binding protein